MPEGTEASQWAPSPASKAPASKEPGKEGGNARAPRGNNNNGARRGRPRGRQSSANTNTGGASVADAEPPAATAPANDAPHKKLIDRLDMTPETAPASAPAPKSDSPATSRRGKGRAGPKRKPAPAKVNTAAAQKELEQETVEEPEPIVPEPVAEPPKDAPPHINSTDADGNTLAPSVNGLADRLKALNPSAPTTPRPFTPSAIDWAGDTEDGSLPDLDDWGVTAKPASPTDKGEPGSKPAEKAAPSVPDTKPNGRNNRRNEPRAGKNLSVPGRNGPNANGNGSSRPVTPSSAGFGSPSLRNRQGPRASPRTSTLNDPPPHITVTSNTTEDQSKPVTQGLGLDFADEPVFASINDPPMEPPPEDLHIKPVRAPNTHPNRGARGRGGGGRPRMSDGNGQPRPGSGFGAPMHMPPSPHMQPSPYMPPSPHMPPSPYLPNGPFAPNGYPGFNPGQQPMGYPQPHSPGFGGPGPVYGHQHSYSHPQHSPRHNTHHHSSRNNTHQDSTAPRHQRTHSRPVIAGSALSSLNRAVQGTVNPPKPKADVTS